MAKGKVGRPSKLDKDTMKEANIIFIIIIIIKAINAIPIILITSSILHAPFNLLQIKQCSNCIKKRANFLNNQC